MSMVLPSDLRETTNRRVQELTYATEHQADLRSVCLVPVAVACL